MDIRQISLDMLIKQRDTIVSDIQEFKKSFHTCFFSLITLSAAVISLSITQTITITFDLAFVLFQAFFLASLFLLGILISMNNNRDYIRAIDEYISGSYGISTLFYQGEISYKHINGFKSGFSVITTLGSASIFILLGVLFVRNLDKVLEIIGKNLPFSIIIIIELLCVLFIIGKNIKYKIDGKSKFYSDTLQYLRNADIDNIGAAPQTNLNAREIPVVSKNTNVKVRKKSSEKN